MIQYSHYILAARAAPLLQPDNLADYFWGTLVPDVRYLAHMRRKMTHLHPEEIQGWAAQYPHLRSFILGYRVHCLLDDILLAEVVGRAFPLNLVQWLSRQRLAYQHFAVLTELYFLQSPPVKQPISGEYNEIIACLGVSREHAAAYACAMQEYIASPTFETAMRAFQKLGLVNDDRIDRYLGAARSINNNLVLQKFLVASVRNSGLERLALREIQAAMV